MVRARASRGFDRILLSSSVLPRRPYCNGTVPLQRVSLDICPLGELIDIYHTYKATNRHNKIYALLGISLDNLSAAGLSPNY